MKHTLHNPTMPDVSMRPHGMVFGGGGGGATSSTSLPAWAQPYVESSLGKAVGTEAAGGFSHVQGLTPEQQDSLQRQGELGQRGGVLDSVAQDAYGGSQVFRDAAGGTGLFGADAFGKQLKASEAQIGPAIAALQGQNQGQQALGGQLGSARAQAANNKASTDLASSIAGTELAARRNAGFQGAQNLVSSIPGLQQGFTAGSQLTGAAGDALQQQGQREGDRAYQGIQRLFGLYDSPSIGSKTTQSGGGK